MINNVANIEICCSQYILWEGMGYERSRYGYQHIPNINTFIFTIRGMKYRTYNFRQIVNSNEKVEIVKSVEQNITLFLFP